MKSAYLRFLKLRDSIEQTSMLKSLDECARRLLEVIFAKHQSGRTLTISEAMLLSSIASPATIHRKINILLTSGLVEFEFRNGNNRTKYLVPTKLANTHYEILGRALAKAFQNL